MPKKKITESQQEDLHHKKEWCLTILNYVIEREADNSFFKQMKDVVNETYSNQNVKGMQYCYNDINEMAKGLPISQLSQLDVLLRTKFGKGFREKHKVDMSIVGSIVKSGSIVNEDEYRMILDYVEEILNDKSKSNEIAVLNNLLANYHK